MTRPFLWAHRGVSAMAPENTMAAFSLAIDCGADGIELDIHLTGDGVPVVMHDSTVDRTTDGTGDVANLSLPQIEVLDAGAWFHKAFAGETVPLLEHVLKVFGGQLSLNLEIKDFGAGQEVLALLKQFTNADVVVSSFDVEVLEQLRAKDTSLHMAVLFAEGNWRRFVDLASELSARSFHPAATAVTRPMLASCVRANLPVHVWTVDSPVQARSLYRAGVSGIFTNDPAMLDSAFFTPREKL